MEGGAYGAGKAGGAFDPQTFIRQPHTVLRLVSWVFSIVVFGSIVNEGYLNHASEEEEFCIYNRNPDACNYGVTVGVLSFLSCVVYLALDIYFPQISSVKDRKKAVISDIGVSVAGLQARRQPPERGDGRRPGRHRLLLLLHLHLGGPGGPGVPAVPDRRRLGPLLPRLHGP